MLKMETYKTEERLAKKETSTLSGAKPNFPEAKSNLHKVFHFSVSVLLWAPFKLNLMFQTVKNRDSLIEQHDPKHRESY